MKRLRFHPEAQIEMIESAKYYEGERAGLGKRFLEAIRASIHKVRLFPSIYQRLDGKVRRCCVERFTFGVVFREEDNEIQIIAVVHFKRDPDHWKKRL